MNQLFNRDFIDTIKDSIDEGLFSMESNRLHSKELEKTSFRSTISVPGIVIKSFLIVILSDYYMGRRQEPLIDRREGAYWWYFGPWAPLSDLGTLKCCIAWDCYLNSGSLIIRLPVIQLWIHHFAAWTFCRWLSRALPTPFVVSRQTPTTAPFCFIKLWQFMEPVKITLSCSCLAFCYRLKL